MRGADDTFPELRRVLVELFRQGVGSRLSDSEFDSLAIRVFRFQCKANPAYGGYVRRRGVDPDRLGRWRDFPFLPTAAFKSFPLVAGDEHDVERIFRTSGTTRGTAGRGEHHVRDLGLYRESLLPNFRAHIMPEDDPLPVLCLMASPTDAPDSSLSFMMGEVATRLGRGLGDFFIDAGGNIRAQDFRAALGAAEENNQPIVLAGTAFAFVHWLEIAEGERWTVSLPEGSRIMETGGFKGRSSELRREDLYAGLARAFGVPARNVVNEYGMTELLSQFYEPTLGEKGHLDRRFHRGPPWVRTLVLNPRSLEPVTRGSTGVLAHFDLANLGSVSAILTEDLGREVDGGFRLLGRVPGSEPRGCSLAMEEFLLSVASEKGEE